MSAKDGKTQLLDNAKCKKVKGAFCKSLMGITMKKIVNKSCADFMTHVCQILSNEQERQTGT